MKRDPSLTWRRVDAASLTFNGLKVAIVGGRGGIGRGFSRFLAARGASVISIGQTFRDAGVPGIAFAPADLNDTREAERVGNMLPAETLDRVLLTTGIFAAPQRQETPEGLERDPAVSYLSRYVIVRRTGTGWESSVHRLRGNPVCSFRGIRAQA